ncbi:MAG TPA: hypothetical protein VG298_09080 [Acidimicrobiales bacterium]|nr:hypothetical protein [Acidimicrobiales bacterium]
MSEPGEVDPRFPVEAHFAQRGEFEVATTSVSDDGGRATYEIFYPRPLGRDGGRHPMVTWGNGTAAQPRQYPGVLHQLASWGMVVVASTSKRTGKGHQMLEGVHHLLREHQDRGSVFFDQLDGARVGAVGHSQGAGGSVNATILSDGLITTTVPICLPNERWVSKGDEYDVAALGSSVLFLGGGRDRIIAGPGTLRDFYARAHAPAGVALLRGAGHKRIQKSGGGYLGYLTAWLRFQLFDDQLARQAFAVEDPEFLRNPAWQSQGLKLSA